MYSLHGFWPGNNNSNSNNNNNNNDTAHHVAQCAISGIYIYIYIYPRTICRVKGRGQELAYCTTDQRPSADFERSHLYTFIALRQPRDDSRLATNTTIVSARRHNNNYCICIAVLKATFRWKPLILSAENNGSRLPAGDTRSSTHADPYTVTHHGHRPYYIVGRRLTTNGHLQTDAICPSATIRAALYRREYQPGPNRSAQWSFCKWRHPRTSKESPTADWKRRCGRSAVNLRLRTRSATPTADWPNVRGSTQRNRRRGRQIVLDSNEEHIDGDNTVLTELTWTIERHTVCLSVCLTVCPSIHT